MITSCSFGHAHLWYPVRYPPLKMYGEQLWWALRISTARMHYQILCPENLLQSYAFCVWIGEVAIEQWCLKQVTTRNPNLHCTCELINSSFQNWQQVSIEKEPKKKSERGGHTCYIPGCYSNMKWDQKLYFHNYHRLASSLPFDKFRLSASSVSPPTL